MAARQPWREIEGRYNVAGGARNAARERLASIIVMLGKMHYDIEETGKSKGRAIELFDKPDYAAGR